MVRLLQLDYCRESYRVERKENPPDQSEPLEYFQLGRRIRRGLADCSRVAGDAGDADVSYLWLQLGASEAPNRLTEDHLLNIIDEAASVGANWLVVTLGASQARAHVPALCQWAYHTHGMVVCLHAPDGRLSAEEHALMEALPAESSFLLVEPEHAAAFAQLKEAGIHVSLASPAGAEDEAPCDYPHRMIFVDAEGRLYTCGLVSGDDEFFLGSVFDGSLNEIIHNPALPHSVPSPAPTGHQNCSGCPPLVAKYLCNR